MEEQKKKEKTKENKVNGYIAFSFIVLVVVFCLYIVISTFWESQKEKRQKELTEQFHQELEQELAKIDGNNGCRFHDNVIYVYVPKEFLIGSEDAKKNYCFTYQDTITSIRNQYDELKDGYYQPVYFIDSSERRLASCDALGKYKKEE